MKTRQEMITKARQAQNNAYAVYSNFHVGVCLRTEDDALFSGGNVENAAYPVGQCAETSAIGAMIAAGKRNIKEVVVVGPNQTLCPPCGACRQRLSEFATPETPIHLYSSDDRHQTFLLGELLPEAFGPNNLDPS